jgi:GNAT superfamily N-acetyltransferase
MSVQDRLEDDHPGVEFWLTRRGDYLELNKLVVPESERGEGAGSAFMSDLTEIADDRGLVLAVTPSTDFGGTSRERLENFYRNFGFVKNAGAARDHRTREAMYRTPGGGGW